MEELQQHQGEWFFLHELNVDKVFSTIQRADYLILYYIKVEQEEHPGAKLYLADLAAAMGLRVTELSKGIEKLQDSGFVTWKTDREAGRTYVELSSKAVEANIPNLLPAMLQGLEGMGIDVGTPIFVQYARVAIMDAIGEELKPEAAIVLLGERPGLGTAESMSAYMGYQPRAGMVESERTVVSNIHKGGTPAAGQRVHHQPGECPVAH